MLLVLASTAFAERTYTVRKGDTVFSIAKHFGISVSAVKKANNLEGHKLSTGQILTIPSTNRPSVYGRALRGNLLVVTEDELIATLEEDDRFEVVGRDGDRIKVRLANGKSGWTDSDGVSLEEGDNVALRPSDHSARLDLVRKALSYRGTRYRRGGESVSSGFDCSGFVKHVFASFGVKLPHSSRDQYRYGTPVAKNDLKEGDVLFFAGTYRRGISHVGVYIGDGKFVHASTRRYGVRVDDLDNDYYRRHYYGARRIE